MGFLDLPELPECDDATMATAVRRVIERQAADVAAPSVGPRALTGRLPAVARLERGAEQMLAESSEDADAARYFSAIVEACFLAAVADGFADEERSAVANLIAYVSGKAVSGERAGLMLDGFQKLLDEQGLEKRLDAVAGQFDDFVAREEAMSFAALVSLADRVLADKEALTLMALGKRFDFSKGEVQAVIQQVAASLAQALKRVCP